MPECDSSRPRITPHRATSREGFTARLVPPTNHNKPLPIERMSNWTLDRKIGVAALATWALTAGAGAIEYGRLTEKFARLDSESEELRELKGAAEEAIRKAREAKGPKGDRGERGPQGPKGDTGESGPQGQRGDRGDKGPIGKNGDAGPKGNKGDKGDTGPRGDQGPTGPQGPRGVTGDRGPKGLPGNVPVGTILAWVPGAESLPPGWRVCDGRYGTPDLSGRFLRGTTSPNVAGRLSENTIGSRVITSSGDVASSQTKSIGSLAAGTTGYHNGHHYHAFNVPAPDHCFVVFIMRVD